MKILIIDSDRSFRNGLKYGLKDLGWLVTEVCDGNQVRIRLS